jgi:eukaryotic-like serine/threonine-protein kinase
MIIRCHNCNQFVEIVESEHNTVVACGSCGSSISTERTEQSDMAATTIFQSKMCAHFRLAELIGEGSYGFVYRAYDTRLDRAVAIKFPKSHTLQLSDKSRFLREARAAAQLKHPNIVAIHEVGEEDGLPYIVTDFIQGLNLRQLLSTKKLSSQEAANLCLKIADALEYAHSFGIVHRDLKPANIMVDLKGEPALMDFGLAKRQETDATMTIEGTLVGTPAYMSPEQARGMGSTVDRRADVYSIGVVFYELLTHELPFRGDREMLIYQILMEDPPNPKKLNSKIPSDLITICLKCMEKQPEKRYQNCTELATDLRLFQEGKAIQARRIGTIGKVWRWYIRNPQATLLASAGYTLCQLIVLTMWALTGCLFFICGIHPISQPLLAAAELLTFVMILYIPGIVACIRVLNGSYRFIYLCNFVLVMMGSYVVLYLLNMLPPLESLRAAQNSDYVRYQLGTLIGILVTMGLILGLNAQLSLNRLKMNELHK